MMLNACSGPSSQPAGDGAGGRPGSDGGTPDATEVAGDSGAAISEELCAAMCAVALQIDCPDQPTMSACVADCLGQTTVCVPESKAYFECIIAAGSASLQCNPDLHIVEVRDGYCMQQIEQLFTCLTS